METVKKEPADLHIVKSNAFGITGINHGVMASKINTRRLSSLFSPQRSETERDFQYSQSNMSQHNKTTTMGNFDSKFFKYTSKERTDDFKQIRLELQSQKAREVIKIREINKLMKNFGKEEHQNNIKLFQKYNEDEKQVIKALISKQKEDDKNSKINKKLSVIKQSRRKEKHKRDRDFALNFTRQKNLIEKYEQAGEKSKQIRLEKIEKSNKIRSLR
jgi:hypothetical protein